MNTKTLIQRRKKLAALKKQSAFSLIELLVVIAVIGIIAAIAIPNIGNLTGGATIAKNQRNAQTIASVSQSAIAAGRTQLGADAAAEFTQLKAGVKGEGSLTNATFQVDMSQEDFEGAQGFLNYSSTNGFSYVQEGVSQGGGGGN